MPFLSDYAVLRDGSFSLNAGEERTFTFPANSDFFTNGLINRPVLMFKYLIDTNSSTSSGNAILDIDVNDTVVVNGLEISRDAQFPVGYWEVVNQNVIRGGVDNTVQFRVIEGGIRIADVIMLFQRNV